MEADLILSKMELLPEVLRIQVIDYIDFLTNRYISEDIETFEDELTDEMKIFLDERIAYHNENPEKAMSGDEFLNKMAQKYNYEL